MLDGYGSLVVQPSDWAPRMAADIGQRVARLREERGISAQQLADRCSDLGLPAMSRIVITRLENGRREAVSTAELAVLAAALDVAPVELLFPVGSQDLTEALPGQEWRTLYTVQWFIGKLKLDGFGGFYRPQRLADQTDTALLEEHEDTIGEWEKYLQRQIELNPMQSDEADREWNLVRTYMDRLEGTLRAVRSEMRHRGMLLPDLGSDVAFMTRIDEDGREDR